MRLSVLAVAALCAAALAAPSLADDEQLALSNRDAAIARKAVLHRGDFPPYKNWGGGPLAAQLPLRPPCRDFDPKQSDLLVTGAADAEYDFSGLRFFSQVQLMQTPQMALLASKRYAVPQFASCLKSNIRAAHGVPVSVTHVPVQRFGDYVALFHTIIEWPKTGHRTLWDVVIGSYGRVRVLFWTSAPLVPGESTAVQSEVRATELALAQKVELRGNS